ncbi:polysaccharide deacetylase family protein [Haloarcula nitratireducens]|uniref:Polysaccharide deacetylase family protein n=1 Tax=Haloarcula nitratireducens TaxID=2487749 RepID=A0AAW4P7V2_9EURY|nr:polysaccharide deacetylase family protein [Halomicroarcula nitratireducens]MBX0293816.1 polysaccharide deacetylase family protein [Halomicroarcula nitratireducens]
MTSRNPISRHGLLKRGAAALTALGTTASIGRARAATEHPLLNTAFDTAERYADSGQLLDDFEDLSRWTAQSGHLNATTDQPYRGSQSAELLLGPDEGTDLEIVRYFDDPIDLSNKDLSIALRLESPSTEQLDVRAYSGDDYVEMRRRTITTSYGWFRIDLGVTSEYGDPDLSSVDAISLEFYRDFDTDLRVWVDDLRTTERADTGRVIVTFDDGGITQYTNALPIMEDRGIPGLTMINSARASSSNYIGEDEMREMRDAGWEIGSHTVDHEHLPDLSNADARAQIEENKKWLLDRGFERGASMFSYPWSGNSPRIRDIVSDYHYLAVTDGSLPHGRQLTGPLTVGRVFGEELERVYDVLDLAEKYNQTAVLAYHQVGAEGWISEDDFRATMDRIADSSIEAIRPSKQLTELQSPPVEEIVPLSIREAVAGDGNFEGVEAQRAVHWYRENEYVPRTNGKKIDDATMNELAAAWSND